MLVEPTEHTVYTIMEKKINSLEKKLKKYILKYGDNIN